MYRMIDVDGKGEVRFVFMSIVAAIIRHTVVL